MRDCALYLPTSTLTDKPLPASVETTNVLLGVDTETASHPTIAISMPH